MIMDVKYKVPPHVSDGCRRLIGRMLQVCLSIFNDTAGMYRDK